MFKVIRIKATFFAHLGRAPRAEVLAIMGDNVKQTAGVPTICGLRFGRFLTLCNGRLRVFDRRQKKIKLENFINY